MLITVDLSHTLTHPCPQLAHSLGNDKPSTLQRVEDAVLRMVINVADGSTAQNEVQTFLQEFTNMTSIWKREDRSPEEYRFFAPCEFITHNIGCIAFILFECSA